jgi:cobalt-zinc-cadmium efflux system outer membrane protein
LSVGLDNLTVTGPQAFQLGADEMTMRRIGITQAWPSRQKRVAQRALGDAALVTAIAQARAMRLEVERAAAEAWLEVWAADAEQAFLTDLQEDAARAEAIATAQLAAATGTSTDALSAKAARAELDNDRRRAQAQVLAARAGLERWVGALVEAPLAPLPDLTELRDTPTRLRDALDQHAHLQAWTGRELAAERAVDLARAGKRPDLEFSVGYGARAAGLPDMMMFEVNVGLPFFTRNRQDRDIAARLAERDAIQAERENARREQRESLERLIAQWEGLKEERARYESTLLPLSRDRSAVALAAFGGGAELLPWIQARREEIDVRRRHIRLVVELARAWIALDTLLPPTDSTPENSL